MKRTESLHSLTQLLFRTILVWYIVAVFLEIVFPGFVSNYISLDWFVWCVILLAVISITIQRKRA